MSALTEADKVLLERIARSDDPVLAATRIHEYYRDMDRADRTPRHMLYYHLGLLVGGTLRLKEAS